MNKFLKVKCILVFLACVFFTSADIYGFDVNSFADLENAIRGSESSITFTNGNIVYTSSLTAINYTVPVNFYGDVILSANNNQRFFDFSATSANFNNDISFIRGSGIKNGGAISVLNSNINFNGYTVKFASNTATGRGGAISSDNSTSRFTGLDISFSNNEARNYAGALYLTNKSTAIFKDSNVNFASNTAVQGGGAIFVGNNSKIAVENSSSIFAGNSSEEGGAIFADMSNMNFTSSTINFESNTATYGGAIGVYNSDVDFENAYVDFTSNTANDVGGAVYLDGSSTAVFTNSEIKFTANSANSGGAVYAGGSNIGVGKTTASFSGNKATDGGAVYASNSKIDFEDSYIDFTANKAGQRGGAIFVSGSTAAFTNSEVNFENNISTNFGGAVYADKSEIKFEDSNVDFAGNTAGRNGRGGAIYANSSNISVEKTTAVFFANSAANDVGGAVSLYDNSMAVFKDSNITFASNTAATHGGGISAVYNSNVKFEGSNVDFVGNTAGQSGRGGAVYLFDGSTAVFKNSKVNFENNASKSYGGAVRVDASNITIENSTAVFFNNKAESSYSGAIDLENNSIAVFKDSSINFTSNTANHGGAISVADSNISVEKTIAVFSGNRATDGGTINAGNAKINFENSEIDFTENKAGQRGGVIFVSVSTVTFMNSEVNFENNMSTNSGGAIFAGGSNINIENSTAVFADNRAANNSGGAIFLQNKSTVFFANSNINFTSNTAANQYGGALFASGSNINIENSTAVFAGNRAANNSGGAIYLQNNSTAFFTNSSINFASNTARSSGGAIYIDNSSIDFGNSEITATGNVAVSSGGFLYSSANTNINIDLSKIYLASNTAAIGGTFYGQSGTTFTFTAANSNVSNSTASYAGGFIALGSGGYADFSGTYLNASANTAGEDGGFMYLSGAGALFGDANFTNNNVTNTYSRGAVIYLTNNSTAAFADSDINFTSNTAKSGGAIYAYDSNIAIENSTAAFYGNNAAGFDGGAIFLWGNSTADFKDSNINFTSNTSRGTGGAIHTYESNIAIENSTAAFYGNSADFDGGAIFLMDSSTANFKNSNINFTSNTARGSNGGAISSWINFGIAIENSTAIFVGNNAGASGSGGAIYLLKSKAKIKDSNVIFTSNTAGTIGGAISADNSDITVENSTAVFSGNSAGVGGTIRLWESKAEFKDSNVNFTSNTTSYGGAIYAAGNSKISIETSTAAFYGNNVSYSGGAIYLTEHSTANFKDSNINFTSNTADSGGAIYAAENSKISVEKSTAVFYGNNAAGSIGGAICLTENSTANFKDSNINFINNTANSGGAIYIDNSSIDFWNSEITAEGNVAVSSGGFLYSAANININIDLSKIHLASNTAAIGGTFYGKDSTTFTFTAANSNMSNSSASYAGGYIALEEDGTADFKSTILKAAGNSAAKGGFMYLADSSALFDKAEFENNKAEKGGAIALYDRGLIEFTGETIFRNNNAAEGGAVYAEGKVGNRYRTILSAYGNVIFEGNKANNTANDIYLGENINFELRTGSNSVVSVGGGIKGLESSTFTKTGSGKIELLSNSVNEHFGEFKIEQGIVENETAAATFGKLNIGADGVYSLENNNSMQVTTVGEANIDGILKIDVDLDNQRADMLKALNVTPNASGNVYLTRETSKLEVNMYGTKAGESNITIIETEGERIGYFGNDPFKVMGYSRAIGGNNYVLKYYKDHVDVSIIQGSNFEKGLEKLTHNQEEAARSVDRITAGMTSGAAVRAEFEDIMKKIEKMGNDKDKKRALDEMSGSVIANMLSAGAYSYGNEEIFERMQPRVINNEDDKISKSVWGQAYGYGQYNDEDENSVEEFKINGYGIEAGADLLTGENTIGGLYAGYERSSGKQGESKGEIEAVGAGLYGGWFGENLDIKARVYGGKLQYKINRELKLLGEKAESEMDAYNFKGDILAQYNIWFSDKLSIAPYGQVKGGYVSNSGARDKGRGGANIEIYDGSYTRLEGILGVGINYIVGRLSLYGRVSGGYVALGERAEYKGEFIDTGEEMEIWGATGGRVTAGAGIGAEYEITRNWSVYANVSGNYYEGGKGYYGNIGVNYSFGMGRKKEIYEIKVEYEEINKKSEEIMLTEKEILNVWKVKGERGSKAEIRKEVGIKIGVAEGEKVYVMKYDDRVLFFGNKEDSERFKNKMKEEGKQAKVSETVVSAGKISFKGYEKELGDMREGMLIVQYGNGVNEIKAIPEEAKRAQRNMVIEDVLGRSNASMIWELSAEDEVIKLDEEVSGRLGIKKGNKIYLLSYGNRAFLFENKADAQEFVKRLKSAGANIDEGDIGEIEGLEVRRGKMELKTEDIKVIGDLSKGVRLEYYEKDKTTEIKSIAQEEKKTKEGEITDEKLESAKERREKPVIKKYSLNVATFKLNDYKLSAKAKEMIEEQAREMRKYDYNKITVEGHTDSSGSKDINERLSRQRAESVYNEFLLNGIPANKISYVGYGSRVPMAPNTTKEGRAANRRTEIYIE